MMTRRQIMAYCKLLLFISFPMHSIFELSHWLGVKWRLYLNCTKTQSMEWCRNLSIQSKWMIIARSMKILNSTLFGLNIFFYGNFFKFMYALTILAFRSCFCSLYDSGHLLVQWCHLIFQQPVFQFQCRQLLLLDSPILLVTVIATWRVIS